MKRSLLIGGLIAGAFLLPTLASAGVSGTCSTCHTMHNSQNANAMNASGAVGTLYGTLLKDNGCAGCHTGGDNDSGTGRDALKYGAPQVDDDAQPVSGGYFPPTGLDQDFAHNVSELYGSAGDTNLGIAPPGAGGSRTGFATFSCSTCHDGSGGHHGVTPGYRMLSGVTGTGDSNFGVAGRDSNVYDGSINDFCASCHGDFHGNSNQETAAASGIWKRHPTDISLADYSGTSIAITASATAEVVMGDDGAGTIDVVLCLSCHVPHGGAYPDLLSYNYTAIQASDGDATVGCEICHNVNFDN
jgi:hypothetical protein